MFMPTEEHRKKCLALLEEKITSEYLNGSEQSANNKTKSLGPGRIMAITEIVMDLIPVSPDFKYSLEVLAEAQAAVDAYLTKAIKGSFYRPLLSTIPKESKEDHRILVFLPAHGLAFVRDEQFELDIKKNNALADFGVELGKLKNILSKGREGMGCVLTTEQNDILIELEKEAGQGRVSPGRELIIHVGDSKLIIPQKHLKGNRNEDKDYFSFEILPFLQSAIVGENANSHAESELSQFLSQLLKISTALKDNSDRSPFLGLVTIDDTKGPSHLEYCDPILHVAYELSNVKELGHPIAVGGFRLPPPTKK